MTPPCAAFGLIRKENFKYKEEISTKTARKGFETF
jgi:hypothetical protein